MPRALASRAISARPAQNPTQSMRSRRPTALWVARFRIFSQHFR
jgi:hypothetical protein